MSDEKTTNETNKEHRAIFAFLGFLEQWWPVIAGFVAVIWWFSGMENRIANAEEKMQKTETKFEQLVNKLDAFKDSQQAHNSQDDVYKAEIKGEIKSFKSSIDALLQEVRTVREDLRDFRASAHLTREQRK